MAIHTTRRCTLNHVEARLIERLDRRLMREPSFAWGWQRPQMDPRVERLLERWGKVGRA